MTRHPTFRYGSDRLHPGYISILLHLKRAAPDPGNLAADLLAILREHVEQHTTHAQLCVAGDTASMDQKIRITQLDMNLRAIRDGGELEWVIVYCGLTPRDNETLTRFRTFWLIEIIQRRTCHNSPPTPQVVVSVPAYAFHLSEAGAMAWICESLDLLARRTTYGYGTVNADSALNAFGGETWSSYCTMHTLHLAARQARWHFGNAARHRRVNGLAWGNILGPAMAKQLGDPREFIDDFDRRGKEGLARHQIATYPQHLRYTSTLR